MARTAVNLFVLLLSAGCQLFEPKPAESAAPPPPPAPASDEPAPLPPEETPPSPEATAPVDPPAAAAKPVEPGITATGAPTRGKLPKAVIDEKLKAAQPGVLACYEKALQTKPDLRGVVNVDFVVGTEGNVVHAAATSGDDALPDDVTVRCILAEIEKLTFPAPSGGRVFINYPLKLEPPKP